MINSVLGAVIQIVNRALTYDPATQRKLLAFEGKSLLWQISGDDSAQPACVRLSISSENNAAILEGQVVEKNAEASVILHGSLGAIMTLLLEQNQSTQKAGLRIEGDLHFLNSLKSILSDLDIDWEAALASKLGDANAHIVGGLFAKQHQQTKHFIKSVPDYLHDLLTEELRSCAHRYELQSFYEQVDTLQSDCARLEARINKLAKR